MYRSAFKPPVPDADQPRTGEGDIISEIYDHIMAGSSREELRRVFAGTVVYVSSRPRLSESQKAAIAQELQRDPVAVVARRWGITERHCRRLRSGGKPRSGGL